MQQLTPDEEERFWAQVDRSGGPDACWEWQGRRQRNYGRLGIVGRSESTHRIAYGLTEGEIPLDMYVSHTCHNRACCNPAHLRLMTKSEYMKARRAPQSPGAT